MAFETGTASDHIDLFHRIRSCITGLRLIPQSDMTFGGGDGTELNELRCKSAITEETITFTCNNAGGSRVVTNQPLSNYDFSSGLTNWTQTVGTYTVSTHLGKQCISASNQSDATITQTVTLSAGTHTNIDSGDAIAKLGWLQTNDAHSDSVYMKMVFVDGVDADISSVESDDKTTVNNLHTLKTFTKKVPANTRKIRVEVRMKNNSDSTVHTNYTDILGYVTEVTLDIIEDELEFGITSTTTYSTAGKFYDGEDYDDNYLKFKFEKDVTAWVLTETITFSAVQPREGQEWAVEQPNAPWSGVQYFENDGYDVSKKARFNLYLRSVFASSHFEILARGSVGYSSATERNNQQGTHTLDAYFRLDDGQMDYWIFTSKRQVIVVVKIVSWYMCIHLGYMNPYAAPSEHPYPLYMAGNASTSDVYNSVTNLSGTRGPSDPGNGCYIMDYAGAWGEVRNHNSTSSEHNGYSPAGRDDYRVVPTWYGDSSDHKGIYIEPYDSQGGFEIRTLMPLKIIQDSNPPILIGEIEGMFWPCSSNNIAEEVITISGDDYYVFPIRNLTSTAHFYAIKKVDA